jgi:hypothetical protein
MPMAWPLQHFGAETDPPMKNILSLLAAAVISLATGCVSVKREEPATTRTTTVSSPVSAASVSTTTY